MSLAQWKSDEIMSLKEKKNVPQLVKKYRERYPYLDRDLMRKIIRLENNITNPSELKKLDRHLKKAYETKTRNVEGICDSLAEKSEKTEVPKELIRFWEKAEFLANQFPDIYGPLKDFTDNQKRLRKEFKVKDE
jgi:hypothetical protein